MLAKITLKMVAPVCGVLHALTPPPPSPGRPFHASDGDPVKQPPPPLPITSSSRVGFRLTRHQSRQIKMGGLVRGLEPIEWHPSTDFAVTSEGGTVYESDAVDLSEEDWTEYCEKSSAPVSIMEIEHKFETA